MSRIPYEKAFDLMHGDFDPLCEKENSQFVIPSYGQEYVQEELKDGMDEGKDDHILYYVPETQFSDENEEVCL